MSHQLLRLLLALTFLIAACGRAAPAAPAAPPPPSGSAADAPAGAIRVAQGEREEAHAFTLETLDGGSMSLGDLRGEWVVVNFWATWCAPCVEEMPYLDALARERDLTVLGVNFNEERERVAAFVEEHSISFPILLEPDDVTKIMYQARALPRTVVVAPDGTVAAEVYGVIPEDAFGEFLDGQGVGRRE